MPNEESTFSIQDQSDETLLEVFQKTKNPEAVGEMFQRYRNQLHLFLWKFLRDEEAIQEALQDTFLHLMEGIDTFEVGRKASPWLFGIAKWTAMTHRRKR